MFFSKPPLHVVLTDASGFFTQAKAHFISYPDIIISIDQREQAFLRQLALSRNESEKEKIRSCYKLFAHTLFKCTNTESCNISELAIDYFTSPYYRNIGGEEGSHSHTEADDINSIILKISLILTAISIAFLPFCIPVSLSLLGLAMPFLLLTGCYSFLETLPNELLIKKEESDLFDRITLAVKEINFNKTREDEEFSNLTEKQVLSQ
jgi:hypothetical protein